MAQKNTKYKFEYRVENKKQKDTSYAAITYTADSANHITIEGQVTNNELMPLAFTAISFKKLASGKSEPIITDYRGQFKFRLQNGSYEIGIYNMEYESIVAAIDTANAKVEMNIMLERKSPHGSYIIRSVEEMSTEDIDNVKSCVEQFPENPSRCNRKNKYMVIIKKQN